MLYMYSSFKWKASLEERNCHEKDKEKQLIPQSKSCSEGALKEKGQIVKLKLKKWRAVIHRPWITTHFDLESMHTAAYTAVTQSGVNDGVSVAAYLEQEFLPFLFCLYKIKHC